MMGINYCFSTRRRNSQHLDAGMLRCMQGHTALCRLQGYPPLPRARVRGMRHAHGPVDIPSSAASGGVIYSQAMHENRPHGRMSNRIQLTIAGHRSRLIAAGAPAVNVRSPYAYKHFNSLKTFLRLKYEDNSCQVIAAILKNWKS